MSSMLVSDLRFIPVAVMYDNKQAQIWSPQLYVIGFLSRARCIRLPASTHHRRMQVLVLTLRDGGADVIPDSTKAKIPIVRNVNVNDESKRDNNMKTQNQYRSASNCVNVNVQSTTMTK